MVFIDVTAAVADNPPGQYRGGTCLDLEGQVAVLLIGDGSPNRLLHWSGGMLRDRPVPPGLDEPTNTAILADLDGDGAEELFLAGCQDRPDRIVRPSRPGRPLHLLRRPSLTLRVTPLDRRGSGRAGFVVARAGEPLRVYELGSEGLVDLAPSVGLIVPEPAVGTLLTYPLVSPRPDLFVGLRTRGNCLFKNQGDGTFAEVARPYGLEDSEGADGPGEAIPGTSRSDLALTSAQGAHRWYTREVDGSFRDRATPAFAFPGPVTAAIAADFDHDGRTELFMLLDGEPNRLFRPESEPRAPVWLDAGDAVDAIGSGRGAVVADLDRDGQLELLTVGAGETPLRLYRVKRPPGVVLTLWPRTRFGAPARGAIVTLTTSQGSEIQVVPSGDGRFQPQPPSVRFARPATVPIRTVTVTWPSGGKSIVPEANWGDEIIVRCPD